MPSLTSTLRCSKQTNCQELRESGRLNAETVRDFHHVILIVLTHAVDLVHSETQLVDLAPAVFGAPSLCELVHRKGAVRVYTTSELSTCPYGQVLRFRFLLSLGTNF